MNFHDSCGLPMSKIHSIHHDPVPIAAKIVQLTCRQTIYLKIKTLRPAVMFCHPLIGLNFGTSDLSIPEISC